MEGDLVSVSIKLAPAGDGGEVVGGQLASLMIHTRRQNSFF